MENVANIHSTQLDSINEIRRELWKTVYNKIDWYEVYSKNIKSIFKDDLAEIEYDITRMQIYIKTINPDSITTESSSTIIINAKLLKCFIDSLKELKSINKISDELLEKSINHASMLFNLTLNHNGLLIINL